MTAAYNGPERRQPPDAIVTIQSHERRSNWHSPQDCVVLLEAQLRFKEWEERMQRLEGLLKDYATRNTTLTESVAEILDILTLGKSFFRIIGIFGKMVKWVTVIVTPLVALYFAFKNGLPPKG